MSTIMQGIMQKKYLWFLLRYKECNNNYIKKILSNANGLTNFERARNRIMYSQNKYETYSSSEHKTKIKEDKDPRGSYEKNK